MSNRNTIVRSMHDLGLAAWMGGSLMGAIGLNGAAATADNPNERLSLASAGWARWTPVNAAAIGMHLIGGIGLIAGNKARLAGQDGARVNTGIKLVVTAAALGATAYAGVLGKTIAEHGGEPTAGTTEPANSTSPEAAKAQQQQQWCQWAVPALTAVLVVLAAQQGEQQRPVAGLLGERVRKLTTKH